MVERVLLSQKFDNGQTVIAKFDEATRIMALEFEGKANGALDKAAWRSFNDDAQRLRLKADPKSEFLKNNVALVQGGKIAAEIVGKQNLTQEQVAMKPMTKDYRDGLKAVEITASGDKPALAERLATTSTRTNETPDKDEETEAPPPKTENKTADKAVVAEVKKTNFSSVSGYRNLPTPNSATYGSTLAQNVSFAKDNPQFRDYPEHVKIALGYLGLKEVPGNGSNAELLEMAEAIGVTNFDDSKTWCAVFANYVAQQILGDKFKPYDPTRLKDGKVIESNRAVYTEQFGRKIDDQNDIRAYDWVFFMNNPTHGGIFLGYDSSGNYMVLGGNQGDEVNIMRIPRSSPAPEIRRMQENIPGSEDIAFSTRPELSKYVVETATTA